MKILTDIAGWILDNPVSFVIVIPAVIVVFEALLAVLLKIPGVEKTITKLLDKLFDEF